MGFTPLTDDNILDAVDNWFGDNKEAVKTTYGNIQDWDVAAVTNMTGLFFVLDTFNRDLSGWNIAKVENMFQMFQGATAFNQNLCAWTINEGTDTDFMFSESACPNENNPSVDNVCFDC